MSEEFDFSGSFKRALESQSVRSSRTTIEWFPSEWHTNGFSAYVNGIELDVYRDEVESDWVWSVRPSSSRSETPELYDCGTGRTVQSAQRKAEKAGRKADKSYQHIKY